MTDVFVMGPYVKGEYSYLNPASWYEPNPDDKHGYMLGGIAWYYRLRRDNGGGRCFAAREAVTAEAALRKYLAEQPGMTATWLTHEEARAVDDNSWRCSGCGRRSQEVPLGHSEGAPGEPCTWTKSWYHTRWWPDGTIHDECWTPSQEQS